MSRLFILRNNYGEKILTLLKKKKKLLNKYTGKIFLFRINTLASCVTDVLTENNRD